MLAENETCNVKIAEWLTGQELYEIKAVDLGDRLDDNEDVHFGICNDSFNGKLTKTSLWGLGPRALDIAKRGGRTAEDTWRHQGEPNFDIYCRNCKKILNWGFALYLPSAKKAEIYEYATPKAKFLGTDQVIGQNFHLQKLQCGDCNTQECKLQGISKRRPETPGFASFFTSFNTSKNVNFAKGKDKQPTGAKISGDDVGGQLRYSGAKKIDCSGLQYGIRWSKTALEWVVKEKKGKVHFHLDGLGEIHNTLKKVGDYSHNVTSTELRYVYKNWTRFKDYTVFSALDC